MREAPQTIEAAAVFCHAPVAQDEAHGLAGLAICRYPDDDAFYLFGCDAEWGFIRVTQHTTFDEAKREAEWLSPGIGEAWMHGAMSLNKRSLIERVREAFKGVRLEDGIGLAEARAIDDYWDEGPRKAWREMDEKMDWESILTKHLQSLWDTMAFFDAKGMRFHLPAFLVAELEGNFGYGSLVTVLTHEFYFRNFELFSPEQRDVVRNYLLMIVYTDEQMFHAHEIESALAGYWNGPSLP